VNSKEKSEVTIGKQKVDITHLDKIYWPDEGYTKGDLIGYYRSIASFILPYLKNRPESLNRHPNGINGENFFQKNIPSAPEWVEKKIIYSEDHNINYLLCQNEATLIYMINLGCIEINPWLSRIDSLSKPDFCVLDLDPENIDFKETVKVAQAIHKLLDKIGADNYCKTSGKRGLHIFIPLNASYDYEHSVTFAKLITTIIHQQFPDITSIERSPSKRQKKVYLDYLQNRKGQTVVAPYSVRPKPAATVYTPLEWSEVTASLDPQKFTLLTISKRLEKKGDLWKPVLGKGIDLNVCIKNLSEIL